MNLEELIDRDAEDALIGSLIINPSVIDEMEVAPGDFHQSKARSIFDAMRALRQADIEVDILSIRARIEKIGLDGRDHLSYATGCINKTPTSMNAKHYAARVADLGARRAAIQKASAFAQDIGDLQKPTGETIAKFSMEMPSIARSEGSTVTSTEVASKHYDRMNLLANGKEVLTRYVTGIDPYDYITYGGLVSGELLVLSGQPGLGKTKLMVRMAAGVADHGVPVKVYEMETDESETIDREISRRAKIPTDHFVTGLLDEEYPRYTHAIDEMSRADYPLYWSFDSGWSLGGLRADLIKLKAQLGLKVFMVDYLKFLTDQYGDGETQRLNYLIGGLKRICRSLDLAGVVIHSMSKEGMKAQKPGMTDLSQGADIAYDADKIAILSLYDPSKETSDTQTKECVLKLVKSRRKLRRTAFRLTAAAEYPEFSWQKIDYSQAKPVSNLAPNIQI